MISPDLSVDKMKNSIFEVIKLKGPVPVSYSNLSLDPQWVYAPI